jgi:hypothetical protein
MAVTASTNTKAFHVNDINGLGDLQIDFKFEIRFFWRDNDVLSAITEKLAEDGQKDLTGPGSILDPGAIAGGKSAPMITAYARSVTFPGRQNSVLTDDYQGWKTHYPGKMDMGENVSISFAERQDGAILRVIQAWQELINSTRPDSVRGSFQYTGDFKRDLVGTMAVTMLRTDGSQTGMSGWYYNVWPSNRNQVNLDMTSEDFVKPDIEFVYDWTEIYSYAGR